MKKLAELKPGDRFMYGGVEWVKFEDIGAGTLCLAAEPVFLRAFDEENCNDWRKSSLRRELNGAFLDALVAEGADRAALQFFKALSGAAEKLASATRRRRSRASNQPSGLLLSPRVPIFRNVNSW